MCHLIDVGQVAAALWREVLREPARARVTKHLGLSDSRDAEAWIAFWIAAHDIGKITPCFQFQSNTDKLKSQLNAVGFPTNISGNPHHTVTGTKILDDELARGGNGRPPLARDLARRVAVCVGGHHGAFPVDWDGLVAPLGGDRWAEARREMLDQLANLFGLNGRRVPRPPTDSDQSIWMFLAGLTSVADWIGSNQAFFCPFVDEARPLSDSFDPRAYFADAGTHAARALDALGWLHRSQPTGEPRSFEEATGIKTPRALQEVVRVSAKNDATARRPHLTIVEAPMGEGKTEAAWYIADCWDRCGGAGTYVALPTMATSNQMFSRVGEFLNESGGKSNYMLLHGKAALNKEFEKLKFAARVYDPDGNASGVVAEGWFAANKKHGLLAPYGVGTIDQALLAVLQTKHMFVRLFGLAGKCVILDEVHAYDAYMTTLMKRLLQWLAALGCPVVLLSATLPADKRRELLRAYAGDDMPEPEHVPYPRVTRVAASDAPSVVAFEADPARRKEICLDWVEECNLAGNILESLKDGGCAAVIRNTVGLAQETYLRLKEKFADTDVVVELFHARFLFGRRQQIEGEVLAMYGKGPDGTPANPLRPKKAILVATQVIEQSLDLDFDVMYSDVAPVDLVLQRAGRLHRHERGDRGQPRLVLIKPGEKEGLPDFGVSEWVYARFVLLKSLVALQKCSVVSLPDDLERLVEQIYGAVPLDTPEHYQDALVQSEQQLKEKKRGQNRNAKSVMIWGPETEDLLEQQNLQLEEDDPEAHRKVQAATRDTEPTVQLILVYHLDGSDYLDPDGKEPFDDCEVPDVKRLRRLLDNEVTISDKGCVFHYVGQPVPSGWKRSGMLRHHRVLRVGSDGLSRSDDFIRVDNELSIVIDRNREGESA